MFIADNMSRPLAADKPRRSPESSSAAFYYAHCEGGVFYRSDASFLGFTRLSDTASFPSTPRCDLAAHPASDVGGLFWLAADLEGLFFLDDREGASNLARVSSVAVAHAVAAGAAPPASSEPVLYVFGVLASGNGPWRPFASLNRGATWFDLGSTNEKGLGNWPSVMAASRQAFGLFVVGSFGRGAFWANASSVLTGLRVSMAA